MSHYAARLAAAQTSGKLHLICVHDKSLSDELLNRKTDRIRLECQRLDLELEVLAPAMRGSVVEVIRRTVPAGPESYLLCGTRVRERQQGFLSGTVSEQMLRSGHCHVLAIRVVQPGLLGLPRDFLFPVSGHPRGFRSGLPFLRLFAEQVSQLHLLYVEQVSHRQFRGLSHLSAEVLRHPGEEYCARIEQEIFEHLGLGKGVVDSQVVISDDVPKEIVIAANKTNSKLICLGASERHLTERFFFGNPIEQVLRNTTCDVAVYRGFE